MSIETQEVIQLTVEGKALDQSIVNVLHYRQRIEAPPVPAGDLEQALTAFRAEWRTSILSRMPDAYSVSQYKAEVISSRSGPPPNNSLVIDELAVLAGVPVTDAGTELGAVAATFNAVGARKFTGVPGRNWRGSIRMGPVLEANLIDNQVEEAYAAEIELGLLSLLAFAYVVGADTFAFDMVVFSETGYLAFPGVDPTPRVFSREVQTISVRRDASSQVSRKKGHGAT